MAKIIEILSAERKENKLSWQILIDGQPETVTVTVSDNVSRYLTADRADALVMGMMVFAIRVGYDFRSALPLSEGLWYNITRQFIESVTSHPDTHRPHIDAPLISDPTGGHIVACGMSCGVDSLYSVATHMGLPAKEANLTHLTFFDVGSHDTGRDDGSSERLKQGRLEAAKRFADTVGLPLIEVSSNLPEIMGRYSGGYSHEENHTFMAIFSVLALAKGVSRYYYSSGYSYAEFDTRYEPTGHYDASHYDLLTLMCASYGDIRFYSTGANTSRLAKIRLLADYAPAYDALNVCVNQVRNDNVCFKCRRTMLELDAIGALDKFASVFDLDYYREHRREYLADMYVKALRGDVFMKELLPYFHKELTPAFKLRALMGKARSVVRNRLLM